MQFGIGAIVVIGSVLGGYVAMGGHLQVLMQPFELVIIGGAAVGAYIIGNPPHVLKHTKAILKKAVSKPKYTKQAYVELLCLLYQIFKLVRTKGALAIEAHIEKPEESSVFNQFPIFMSDHHVIEFLCDYLRLWTLGIDDVHKMEDLINEEIETHHHEQSEGADAIQGMADGMPALGIVAAVLGVIKTMGAITEPPAVLGKLIGGALVGTFLGVFLAYGYIGPLATAFKARAHAEGKYLQCIKAALLAHMNGMAPAVSIEFARKTLSEDVRPTFYEVEEAVSQIQAPA
jgi:chemotaxis protein MotA